MIYERYIFRSRTGEMDTFEHDKKMIKLLSQLKNIQKIQNMHLKAK